MLYVFHNNRTIYAGEPEGFLQEVNNDPNIGDLIQDAQRDGSSEHSDHTAGEWQFVYRDETICQWCGKFRMWAREADALELTSNCIGCDACVYCEWVDIVNAPAFENRKNKEMMDEPFMGEIPGFVRDLVLNP